MSGDKVTPQKQTVFVNIMNKKGKLGNKTAKNREI